MAKMTIAAVFALILLGAVSFARGGNYGAFFDPAVGDGLRGLVLFALGTDAVGPGQVRVPIPAEGVTYEVIIAKPGEPKLVLLAKTAD